MIVKDLKGCEHRSLEFILIALLPHKDMQPCSSCQDDTFINYCVLHLIFHYYIILVDLLQLVMTLRL